MKLVNINRIAKLEVSTLELSLLISAMHEHIHKNTDNYTLFLEMCDVYSKMTGKQHIKQCEQ